MADKKNDWLRHRSESQFADQTDIQPEQTFRYRVKVGIMYDLIHKARHCNYTMFFLNLGSTYVQAMLLRADPLLRSTVKLWDPQQPHPGWAWIAQIVILIFEAICTHT